MGLELELEAERVSDAYRKLLRTVVRAVLGEAGTDEDAEDCVQEVLWEYLAHQDRLDGARGTEKTYLCVMARSRARTLRGQLLARQSQSIEEAPALEAPDELEREAVRAALKAALAGLTAEERRLFTLRFLYGWPTAEAAKTLGVSRTNLTTRTARLRAKLKKLLGEQGIEWCGKEREL